MGLPAGELSREAVARREIGRTAITPGVARFLVGGFLAIIVALPLLQAWQELSAYAQGERDRPWPEAFAIAGAFPKVAAGLPGEERGWPRLRRANALLLREMEDYEDRLEEQSAVRRLLLGPMQHGLLCLGAGNESTYPGRAQWLFYRSGIDYVTGPGFLEPPVLRNRGRPKRYLEPEIQPDPVPAILEFHRELRARGIRLVVMPAPVKASVHPEHFSRRCDNLGAPLQNASYANFVERLAGGGVSVLDLAGEIVERKRITGEPQYLARDTHWTPAAMEFAAQRLATHLQQAGLRPGASGLFSRGSAEVSFAGDIAAMLNLRDCESVYPAQTVTIHPVRTAAAESWRPEAEGEVLVLGDSFANIYSMKELGWGSSAGLAEQLSFYLQRPVDRITQNDSGAFATRQDLARHLAQGRDVLRGKQFVVWEFAARELTHGDWRMVSLPERRSSGQNAPPQRADSAAAASGLVL